MKGEALMSKSLFSKGLRHGIPIALGYMGVSFAFGMKAVVDGLSPMQAVLISMLNVTSAGQLAALPQMLALASLLEVALTQLIINMRYALMSLSLSQKLDRSFTISHRMAVSFVNTDEVFAVASAQPGSVSPSYIYGLILLPYVGWVLGTLFGAVAGTMLPDSLRSALGIAIYAMFIAIVLPPSRVSKQIRIVVLLTIAVRLCFVFLPFLKQMSGGLQVVVCAVAAAGVGAILFPREAEVNE